MKTDTGILISILLLLVALLVRTMDSPRTSEINSSIENTSKALTIFERDLKLLEIEIEEIKEAPDCSRCHHLETKGTTP